MLELAPNWKSMLRAFDDDDDDDQHSSHSRENSDAPVGWGYSQDQTCILSLKPIVRERKRPRPEPVEISVRTASHSRVAHHKRHRIDPTVDQDELEGLESELHSENAFAYRPIERETIEDLSKDDGMDDVIVLKHGGTKRPTRKNTTVMVRKRLPSGPSRRSRRPANVSYQGKPHTPARQARPSFVRTWSMNHLQSMAYGDGISSVPRLPRLSRSHQQFLHHQSATGHLSLRFPLTPETAYEQGKGAAHYRRMLHEFLKQNARSSRIGQITMCRLVNLHVESIRSGRNSHSVGIPNAPDHIRLVGFTNRKSRATQNHMNTIVQWSKDPFFQRVLQRLYSPPQRTYIGIVEERLKNPSTRSVGKFPRASDRGMVYVCFVRVRFQAHLKPTVMFYVGQTTSKRKRKLTPVQVRWTQHLKGARIHNNQKNKPQLIQSVLGYTNPEDAIVLCVDSVSQDYMTDNLVSVMRSDLRELESIWAHTLGWGKDDRMDYHCLTKAIDSLD